jgi:hypothetical protein
MTEFQPTPQTPEQVDEGLRNAFRQAIKDGVMDATPYLKQMTFNTDIEKTEAEIKVLQKKLELLKEIEKHKSPVEEAYKDWWGDYPSTNQCIGSIGEIRWSGFQAGYNAAYEEKVREDDDDVVDEPYRNVRAYWDEKDNPKPMDEVVNRLIKKHQAQKLFNRLVDELGYDFDACNDIVDLVEDWILDEQSADGSQNVNTELLVEGFNDAIRKIKEMLR